MKQRPIAIGETYVLSEQEAREIKAIARERSSSNRRSGVRDAAIGPRGGLWLDILGAAGEWAFTQLTSTDFDTTISPRSHGRGEDGGDTIYRGRKIDIKTTDRPNGRLVIAPWHKGADAKTVYALLVMTMPLPPTFRFCGFAQQETVEGFLTDLGHGPTYAVPQGDLVEWFDIPAFLYRCRQHRVVACPDCPDWAFGPTP